jgi:hypothetical protein
MIRLMSRLGLVAVAVVAFTLPALAQFPHPHYLHAMSDLRLARALLDRPDEYNVMVDQNQAVQAIDRAVGELARASINDGVDPRRYAPPPADVRLGHRERLGKARVLLEAAYRDLMIEEDNMAALGWRDLAVKHIQAAHAYVDKALRDKNFDRMMRQ